MKEMNENPILKPEAIEAESFRLITEELQEQQLEIPEKLQAIVKRVIHTTADFSYVETMTFSENAVDTALSLLKSGCNIVTDTTMALSGINKKIAKTLNCTVSCFVSDEDVATLAKERGITRSMVAVEKALSLNPLIYVVGNAPTALLTLHDYCVNQNKKPDFIIGVPVGFVNVVESKDLIMSTDIPFIVSKGRKGGSNVAAAIINGLLYQLER